MKSITEAGDLNGKRVLVRVDWNVPLKDGKVVDEYRIKASLPTIEYLLKAGAKVIVASHIEPKGSSLSFAGQYVPTEVVILPNLRNNPGEEANSEDFAKELASKADIYVNEAFSVSHRKHASVVGVPKFLPSFAGLHFIREVEELSKVFSPEHPFLFILGGAKFETKVPLVEKFLDIADDIFIGGALAKVASTTSMAQNPKISFPVGDISALDANQETLDVLRAKVSEAKFILWNGPLGKYEDGYREGTENLAKIIADSGNKCVVGGGDTLATIEALNLFDKFTFVSTGGGAMLDFLANETLPGIDALRD